MKNQNILYYISPYPLFKQLTINNKMDYSVYNHLIIINSNILMFQNSSKPKIIRTTSPTLTIDKQYTKTITTLNDKVINESIKEDDYSSALSLLSQLQNSIKNGNYGTYSNNKKHYYYHSFVCHHNMALIYQLKNSNKEAKFHLEKAISNYERLQGYITNRQQNVVFITELTKLQLQYCGLLSHCQSHQQAASLGQKCIDRISESARILQAICYEQAILSGQRQTTCNSRQKQGRNEMVDFKPLIISQAESILQELSQLPTPHKLMNQNKEHFQKIITKIFSWKQNENNNEKALKRQLKISNDKNTRNILGLQKLSLQNQYQIGNLMMLSFKLITYSPHPDPIRLLSSHSLKNMVFCSAVSYFTIATQTRFSQPDLSQMKTNMKINEKYKKLSQDERLLKCKILHLKALQITGKLLPTNTSLFAHLCQSFCRNYKFVMDQINEVSEMNSTNTIRLQEKPIKPLQSEQSMSVITQYGFKTQLNLKPTLPIRKRLQKSTSKKGQKNRSNKSIKNVDKNRSSSHNKK